MKKEEEKEILENWKLPKKKYAVIVVDPPWRYDNKRLGDEKHKGNVPYPDMSLNEIAKIPISDLSKNDCILWLWTTNAFMHEAFHLIENWGFTQKTILTWKKNRMGLGNWLRGKTEHCILAIKGKPYIKLTNQTTIIEGKVREHSRKPEEFYQLVGSLCVGTCLDIFAREEREGWDTFGNEKRKFNRDKYKFAGTIKEKRKQQ